MQHWSETEIQILKNHWQSSKKAEIIKLLSNRTWQAIRKKARKLVLCRDQAHMNRFERDNYECFQLEKLLDETPETYYWIGFLMADGHFNDKINRLTIELSIKDKEHLEKLAKFIGLKKVNINGRGNCSIGVQNKQIISQLIKKFNINNRKTYHLNTIIIEDNNLFSSFIAGFIDGDGCIRDKTYDIKISLHGNTLPTIMKWAVKFNKIYNATNIPYINKRKFVVWYITNSEAIVKYKKILLSLNLPIMKRKWDRIDINFKSRIVIFNERKRNAIKLKEQGFSRAQIARILNVKHCATYKYF
jgi:hypothetical protein